MPHYFKEAWRLQHIILVMQDWLVMLNKLDINKYTENDYDTVLKIQDFLTRHKISFWQQQFKTQTDEKIAEKLNTFISHKLARLFKATTYISSEKIWEELIIIKNALAKQISEKESMLTQHHTTSQVIKARLWLAVKQLPDFNFSQATLPTIDQARRNVMGTPLSPSKLKTVEKISGVASVITAIGIKGCMWQAGYSYYLSYALSRIPLEQANFLFSLGKVGEKINAYTVLPLLNAAKKYLPVKLSPLIEFCENTLRSDELGMMEKMQLWQWLAGLLVILILTGGQNVVAESSGYICGTAGGYALMRLIEKTLPKSTSPHAATLLKTISHIIGYITASHYGRRFGFWASTSYTSTNTRNIPLTSTQDISHDKALEIFGLKEKADFTLTDVKKIFHELAIRCHPDKPNNKPCQFSMTEIDTAYEYLCELLDKQHINIYP